MSLITPPSLLTGLGVRLRLPPTVAHQLLSCWRESQFLSFSHVIDSRGQCLAHPQLDLIFTGASSLLPNDWHKSAVEAFQRKSTHRSVHYTSQQRRSSLSFPLVSKSASRATELQSIQTDMDCALSRLRHSDRINTVKCIVENTKDSPDPPSAEQQWVLSRGPLSQSSSERLRRELVWVQRSSSIRSNVNEPLKAPKREWISVPLLNFTNGT